jgi:hypothetical protein
MYIKILHQEDKTEFSFRVMDSNSLTSDEVKRICLKMNVKAIFVNGRYYSK